MIRTKRGFYPRIAGSADFLQRFWSRVDESSDGCWLWMGPRITDKPLQYGLCTILSHTTARRGRLGRAHRVAFMLANGVWVPDHIEICHTCDNPPCCRPDHLFPGTRQENVADMVAKGRNYTGGVPPRTECKRGHPLVGDNLIIGFNHQRGQAKRQCRECNKAWKRQRYHELKSAEQRAS